MKWLNIEIFVTFCDLVQIQVWSTSVVMYFAKFCYSALFNKKKWSYKLDKDL